MNEFIIKNGLIVNGGISTFTGSLTVTGTISSNSTISVGGHGYFTQGIWANTYRNLYGAEVFRITYTTNNVLIGTTVDSGARLHVAAPGALLSDIAFKIRNSADTGDLVTVNGLGQVSIGFPSLSSIYKLGVSGSTVLKGSLIIQDDSGNVSVYDSTGTTSSGGFSFNTYVGANIYTSNANPLKFSVNSSEAMRIVNGGNIGIGTTSPSARLDIRGTQTAAGAIARTMLISSSLSASANNDVLVGLDIAPTFTAGAFTGVQPEQLVIRGNGNPIIRFKNQAGTTTWGQFGANVSELSFNAQAGSINLVAGNNQAMYVFASTRNTLLQNGGTFTDDGINRLQVSGSARITAGLTVTGSLTTKAPGALSTDIAFKIRNSADTADLMSVQGDGVANFSDNIVLSSNKKIYASNSSAYYINIASGANTTDIAGFSGIKLFTGVGSEALRITSTNNVGIGTTTPGAKLDVNGNTIITGTLTTNGNTIITGSLITSGSTGAGINTSTQYLIDTTGVTSLDWDQRKLYDLSSNTSIGWQDRKLYDSSGNEALYWRNRTLSSGGGSISLNWGTDTYLSSEVYQQDIKTTTLQDAVSLSPVSNETYLGDIIEGVVGTVTPPVNGELCYLSTTGKWETYQQTTSSGSYGQMVGLVFNVDGTGGTCQVLLEGHVLINGAGTTGEPIIQSPGFGKPVYIRYQTTTGEMATIIPGAGIVQVLGQCYYQNTTNTDYWMMKFKPSPDWIEL